MKPPVCGHCAYLRSLGYRGCPLHAREEAANKEPTCLCALLAKSHPDLPAGVVARCCPACHAKAAPCGLELFKPGRKPPRGEIVSRNAIKRKWGVFGGFPVPAIVRWMGEDGWDLTEYRVAEEEFGWPWIDAASVRGWLAEGRAFPAEVPDLSFSDESKLYKALAGDQ